VRSLLWLPCQLPVVCTVCDLLLLYLLCCVFAPPALQEAGASLAAQRMAQPQQQQPPEPESSEEAEEAEEADSKPEPPGGQYCSQPISASRVVHSHAPPPAALHTLVAAGLQGSLRMSQVGCLYVKLASLPR
jgi:hypothetical protein